MLNEVLIFSEFFMLRIFKFLDYLQNAKVFLRTDNCQNILILKLKAISPLKKLFHEFSPILQNHCSFY